MKTQVIIALIGAIASVGAAFVSGTFTVTVERSAAKAIEATQEAETVLDIVRGIEKLGVVTAGAVKAGKVVRHVGYPFDVFQEGKGKYKINFRDPFKEVPVVVAISDGGQEGAFAEITHVDTTGFVLLGQTYHSHGLADIGFQFVAIQTIGN